MSAEHRKPIVAFVALAVVAAALVGMQRADAQGGQILAAAIGASVRVEGSLPVSREQAGGVEVLGERSESGGAVALVWSLPGEATEAGEITETEAPAAEDAVAAGRATQVASTNRGRAAGKSGGRAGDRAGDRAAVSTRSRKPADTAAKEAAPVRPLATPSSVPTSGGVAAQGTRARTSSATVTTDDGAVKVGPGKAAKQADKAKAGPGKADKQVDKVAKRADKQSDKQADKAAVRAAKAVKRAGKHHGRASAPGQHGRRGHQRH